MKFLTYFFCTLLITSAAMVIVVRNSLYSVLFLITSFLSASILLFIFESEFLALFFVIIYMGAIAILFLFVVMMLDIKYNELQNNKLYFPVGVLIGSVVLFEIHGAYAKIFSNNTGFNGLENNSYLNWYDNLDSLPDIYVIGQVFYTHYVLQILMAGLILYVAVIGVAFLTVKSAYSRTKVRNQSLSRQLSRTNTL